MPTSVFPGTGDVFGPASATDGALAVFNGTTGKLIAVGSSGTAPTFTSITTGSVIGTGGQILDMSVANVTTLLNGSTAQTFTLGTTLYYDGVNTQLRVGNNPSSGLFFNGQGEFQARREAANATIRIATIGTGFQSFLALDRARGTIASPTGVKTGDLLGSVVGVGYDGISATMSHAPMIDMLVTEDWDATHHGASMKFYSVVDATTAQVLGLTLQGTIATVGSGSGTATLRIAGSSASFPALRNNGAQLECITASGSAFTTFKASTMITDGGYTVTSDNAIDVATAAVRMRTGYFGTSVVNGGYLSGARSTTSTMQSATGAVTLSGASTATTNIIPAGATVVSVATTTTTTITGATGYTVGDGSDVDRWGDKTGTAIGTATGSTDYTADPRWWTNAARAVTLTAKTSNFTGGVVQVTVFYWSAAGA